MHPPPSRSYLARGCKPPARSRLEESDAGRRDGEILWNPGGGVGVDALMADGGCWGSNREGKPARKRKSDCKAPGHEGGGWAAPGRTRSAAIEQPGLHPRGGPPESPLHLASPQRAASLRRPPSWSAASSVRKNHQPVGRERKEKEHDLTGRKKERTTRSNAARILGAITAVNLSCRST